MIIIICFFILSFCMNYVKEKNLKYYFVFVAFAIGYISFHIVPLQESDLFRHFQEIDYYRDYGLQWATMGNRWGQNIGSAIVYYCASFFPTNQYFPAVICSLSYWLIFNLLYKVYVDNKYSRHWLVFSSLFICLTYNYYLLVYCVRFWFAMIVFVYCMYNEMVREKYRLLSMIIYGCLVLFHYGTVILLIIRLLVAIFGNNGKHNLAKKVAVLFLFFGGYFILMQSSVGLLIQNKIMGYSNYTVRGTWQTIFCWTRALGIGALLLFEYRISDVEIKKSNMLFSLFILLLMITQFNNYQITLRFADCIIVSAIPILPKTGNSILRVNKTQIVLLLLEVLSLLYCLYFDYRYLQFSF